jgi:hypothetical protein
MPGGGRSDPGDVWPAYRYCDRTRELAPRRG